MEEEKRPRPKEEFNKRVRKKKDDWEREPAKSVNASRNTSPKGRRLTIQGV